MAFWRSSLIIPLIFSAILAAAPLQESIAEEASTPNKILEPRLHYEKEMTHLLEAFGYGTTDLSETILSPLVLSKEVEVSLLEMAAFIIERFPPDQYDYVSLGRSCAGLAVAMDVLLEKRQSGARVFEFPISGLSRGYFRPQWYKENLKQQFNNFFSGFRQDSKILVMDAVFHGGTLYAFAEILKLAKEEAWIPAEKDVHLLSLFDPRANEALIQQWLENTLGRDSVVQKWTRMKLPKPLSPFFFYSAFDSLAHYSSWYFRDPVYEEAAQTYFSLFGETRRAEGERMQAPKEPRYKKPRNNEVPSWIQRTFGRIRSTQRQLLKEDLRLLVETDAISKKLASHSFANTNCAQILAF